MTDRPEWTNEPELASRRVGGSVVWASDELFAERENLIKPAKPEFRPWSFGHKGQLYDGWETRRRREPGSDEAIVRLGLPGVVSGVIVDTAFFTGNYPPYASIEAVAVEDYPSPAELSALKWTTLVPKSPLQGDTENFLAVWSPYRWTHVRLTIHPDGGVARLRVHGSPVADPGLLDLGALDLAALENGARVCEASNLYFAAPENLIAPGFASVMGEGWETARRRDDGNDWVVIALAATGVPRLAELDTSHFKGNAPGWAALSGSADGEEWFEILPRTRLQPDTRHRFPLDETRELRYLRLDIYPDGGMARLRLHGALTEAGRREFTARFDTTRP
ncbi:allantoicase [Amycolatopsis pithecellobii]|uniref:Probable allantoicase n=1 Tax=Amycolatopsis pithecellobii TaxID=664692 RepID=A0A6N7Z4M0_9PSEU|nr:allantoicase [Amycolatopsis pithecellobii]MTD55314.1 allantoicase [Amycolatopsis pithecellobii]